MRTALLLGLLASFITLAESPKGSTTAPATAKSGKARVIELAVTEDGYAPDSIKVKVGEPVTFRVTRKSDKTCATELVIEGTSIKTALPLDKPVEIAWTPTKAGKVKFGCQMGMMVQGVLLVE